MGAKRLDAPGLALLGVAVADADTVARSERKIVRVPGSECWWWTGAISGRGLLSEPTAIETVPMREVAGPDVLPGFLAVLRTRGLDPDASPA